MTLDYRKVKMRTSEARDRLSEILLFVQDPRQVVILTRYGREVGAIVSMADLNSIWQRYEVAKVARGKSRPWLFYFQKEAGDWLTDAEAADTVQKTQLSRRIERETLARVGLEPLPGGELIEELEVVKEPQPAPEERRRRWWFW